MKTPLDNVITQFDIVLRTCTGSLGSGRTDPKTRRPSPAIEATAGKALSAQERETSARLMRVNHCGEVCAQALYHGQSLTAKSERVAGNMKQAALEETEHLAWCEHRIKELGSHVSYLNPIWYVSSFAMGALTGLLGDKVNLGFVAATEEAVCQHLDDHLEKLPEADTESHAILSQMKLDEAKHMHTALELGGAHFPQPVKGIMRGVSRLMTRTTSWL
jgi:ubiquinone biosynthesis monooxygenase Coq7